LSGSSSGYLLFVLTEVVFHVRKHVVAQLDHLARDIKTAVPLKRSAEAGTVQIRSPLRIGGRLICQKPLIIPSRLHNPSHHLAVGVLCFPPRDVISPDVRSSVLEPIFPSQSALVVPFAQIK